MILLFGGQPGLLRQDAPHLRHAPSAYLAGPFVDAEQFVLGFQKQELLCHV